ncbi:hypothetical protein FRC10_009402 [Ceratobasidium sp. 414]|nr:hypothetical protein FRC10_009402 [Ceratobasidium sp. 414]
MLFTRFFAAALVLAPAVQVLAAPASANSGLSIREPPSPAVQEPTSLEDILASARANIGAIRSQLDSENPQSVQDATIELKTTFDSLIGDLKSLKKAKTTGQNVRLAENGIFDPKSWPIVGEVYEVIKDILTLVDQIKAVTSAPTTGGKLNGVVDILKTIVKAAPSVVSIVMSILPFV